MLIDFEEILFDLEVKRAAAKPPGNRPSIDVAIAVEGIDCQDLDASVVDDSDREVAFTPALAGDMVADAAVVLALARGKTGVDDGDTRALVRSISRRVVERLRGLRGKRAGRLTSHDLSTLVEAVLIESGDVEVAKALVMRRTLAPIRAPRTGGLRLIRRSGHVVAWNEMKIEAAVRQAFLSLAEDPTPAISVARRVTERAESLGLAYLPIETVQDIVQEELVLSGHMRVAERYIIYRAERALLRARERAAPTREHESVPLPIVEADGTEVLWDADDLRFRIQFAAIGLDLMLAPSDIERELRRSIRPGMRRSDLDRLVVLNAKSLVERDSEFSRFAARILLTYIYEETLGWSVADGMEGVRAAHQRGLRSSLQSAARIGRIDPQLLNYDLDRLAQSLDPTADLDFDFLGVQTLYDRYLIIDKSGEVARRLEAPQIFWMRVAMGICLSEDRDREGRVLELYRIYKQRRFCSSTPTLFNAGTPHPQLSSCYLYVVDDSLESIMQRGIAENAMCSKWAGGLGGSWTAVRGTGSHIKGTNGDSQGIVPFLKMHNDQLVAVNQGGKRAGSGCAYVEVWHNDIREFLELRRNTGDERRRTHDMNTANWIPDLFMRRMEAREYWTLFRSSEVPDLHELYGRAFDEQYIEYERKAERGKIYAERIPAIELWKQMLKMLFETGHPWITFKDACNVRSPQDHVGVIHSSNLCTEITLNTSADETAVCNLGSIAIDRHLTPEGELDRDKLRATVRIAVRALDNVIDINFYPTEAARRSNLRHRPIGLGVMGLQYALYEKGISFGSAEAVEFNDEMMEAIALFAYEASSDLAAERGTYPSYEGSKWDRGLLPQDTIDLLETERGEAVEVARGERLDWGPVRRKIAEQGMRNSNVIAIAPTATIANIMGTSPCIEPMYKNLFAKSNLSGDFVILNPYLVRDLKAARNWNRELADQIKYFDGDLTEVESIPEEIKDRYRTAFQIDSAFIIEAAARRQKWIDQSQSLNLFLSEPDLKTLSHMYRRAWRSGLKTTYYLRTLGASAIEKATVSSRLSATTKNPVACSIEAIHGSEDCEACQ
jgi:ribonucleoside-diphosphate reductase alpha chain